MKINSTRFLEDFRSLASIGWTPEGMSRPSYSPAYREGLAFLRGLMEKAGMTTRVDSVGNLFGRYEGSNPSRGAVMTGSHFDAVPNGGRYDGSMGVVSAIEALRSIHEQCGVLPSPLEAVAFVGEEAVKLGGTFGSRAMMGLFPSELSEEGARWSGLSMDDIRAARLDPSGYRAFVELHIEQGPVLERKKIQIGVPTGIVSIVRYRVTLKGQANHAGTTPMSERRSAMRAAAELISEWFRWVDARLAQRDDFVCNVGVFELEPNSPAVVPAQASFVLELRSLSDAVDDEVSQAFSDLIRKYGDWEPQMELLVRKPPVELSEKVISAAEESAKACGFSCQRMPSGASHDTVALARFMPAGMIFVPSWRGISHNKAEHTDDEDMIRGAEVLAETLKRLAE